MNQDLQLKQLKRKTYLAYHKDGLIDIVIGLCFLGFGINMALESTVFSVLGWIWILMYMPLKRRLTYPRFGYVEWKPAHKVSNQWVISISIGVLVLLVAALFLLGTRSASMSPSILSLVKRFHMLALGIVVAIVAVIVGLFTGINRLHTYALMTVLIILAGTWFNIEPAYYVMFIGGLILLWGVGLLARFLRAYPQPAEEG